MSNADTCLFCGEIIPEGRQVCRKCLEQYAGECQKKDKIEEMEWAKTVLLDTVTKGEENKAIIIVQYNDGETTIHLRGNAKVMMKALVNSIAHTICKSIENPKELNKVTKLVCNAIQITTLSMDVIENEKSKYKEGQ